MKLVFERNGFFKSHAAHLKDGGGTIHLPTRALNSHDMFHQIKLEPTLGQKNLPNPILEINQEFNTSTIQSLEIAEASNVVKNMVSDTSVAGGLRYTIFHPIVPKSVIETDAVSRKWLEIQFQSDIDWITIRERRGCSPSEFEERLVQSIKIIEDEDPAKTPMPTLYIAEAKSAFVEKLEIIKRHGVSALDIVYASPVSFYANYLALADYIKENGLFVHASEVNRSWQGNMKTSMTHILTQFGILSSSAKYRHFIHPDAAKRYQELSRQKPKVRFDGKTLGHLTYAEHVAIHGEEIGCDCQTCDGRTLKEFFDVYKSLGILSSAIRIHEVNQSFKELVAERSAILAGSHRDYIKSRKYLHDAISSILKGAPSINQKTLNFGA